MIDSICWNNNSIYTTSIFDSSIITNEAYTITICNGESICFFFLYSLFRFHTHFTVIGFKNKSVYFNVYKIFLALLYKHTISCAFEWDEKDGLFFLNGERITNPRKNSFKVVEIIIIIWWKRWTKSVMIVLFRWRKAREITIEFSEHTVTRQKNLQNE